MNYKRQLFEIVVLIVIVTVTLTITKQKRQHGSVAVEARDSAAGELDE